ncbi:adenylate kinase 8 [Brachyistius frenatus]|uniref:adenylate kinase 8 n=1 Tax=Brachyistius frenatus TaxID=100188 RepID=UPI0037E7E0F7
MDETVKPLRIPAVMSVYADRHHVSHLVQNMVSGLLIDQPDDPISYLIGLLHRISVNVPTVMLLGPPAVGKHMLAKRLSAQLRAVHLTADSLLEDQSEPSVPTEPCVCVCVQGWVLEGIPQTRLQAVSLQQAGILPEHVVLLEAPDDVLLERSLGRLVDPLTGDIYHQTFVRPVDDTIAQRLEKGRGLSEEQRLAWLQRFRCEVTGLSSAYQHVLKVIRAEGPPNDIYTQVLAFVQTRHRSRTPRILLIGPPGSGKSHQARLLSGKYKMVDVCCGWLLRSMAAEGSGLGAEVKPYLDDSRPVPDSLVLQVLEERLSQVDCSCRGWILHGFPCDLQQAKSLQEAQQQPNRVFFLEMTDEVCLERITLRTTDPVSGRRFHDVTRPAPSCKVQNRLQTRPEDSRHTAARRLEHYRIQNTALQSMYPDAIYIDGEQDPHSVFEALESRLTAK